MLRVWMRHSDSSLMYMNAYAGRIIYTSHFGVVSAQMLNENSVCWQ